MYYTIECVINIPDVGPLIKVGARRRLWIWVVAKARLSLVTASWCSSWSILRSVDRTHCKAFVLHQDLSSTLESLLCCSYDIDLVGPLSICSLELIYSTRIPFVCTYPSSFLIFWSPISLIFHIITIHAPFVLVVAVTFAYIFSVLLIHHCSLFVLV